MADIPCIGFLRWARRRLELLGIEILIPPESVARDDLTLSEWAKSLGGLVVTTDRGFPEPKILLPMDRPKYERWLTILLKEISARRRGDPDESRSVVTRHAHPSPRAGPLWAPAPGPSRAKPLGGTGR